MHWWNDKRVLLGLVQSLCLFLLPLQSVAATYWASPTGTGTTCSSGSPCTVSQAILTATTGDTVTLKNGTYSGSTGAINVDNKTGPITIQAENDGLAFITGQFTRTAITVKHSTNITIIGFNACCGTTQTVEAGPGAVDTHYQRIVAWNANPDLNATVMSDYQATRTVWEDVAAWGQGRKAFGMINNTDPTLIRGFFMKTEGHGTTGGNGDVTNYLYNTNGSSRFLNVIGTLDLVSGSNTATNETISPAHYTASPQTPGTFIHYLRGVIAYHVDGQAIGQETALIGNNIAPGDATSTGGVTVDSLNTLAIRRNAAAPNTGIRCNSSTGRTCVRDKWTDSVGTLAGGTHTTDGGALAIGGFNNGLLQLGAATQPADGAWIRYKYNANGTLSANALWPWPMNQRIKDALVSSGFATRGIDGQGATDLTALIMSLTGSTLQAPFHLTYVTQPQNTVEDTNIPGFQVCVYDASNVLQLSYATDITIAIQTNPATGTLSGTTTLTPSSGCVTFNNLNIDNPGVGYTLRVSSGALATADSNAFDITTAPTPGTTDVRVRSIPIPQ